MSANKVRDYITVPARYKSEMKRERHTTDDYKPQIRKYINTHIGEIIKGEDFEELLGTISATAHIAKLIKQGYITRSRVRQGRGKRFSYTWHDMPLEKAEATLANGGVVTRQLVPKFNISSDAMLEVDCQFLNWIDQQTNGEQVIGAINFRKHLRATYNKHEAAKKAAIDKLTGGK